MQQNELSAALRACRSAFISIAVFSGVINVLMLSGSMFMLEVYDRVLPSRSVPTLVGLAAIVGLLYAFQGVLDLIRARLFVRIAGTIDDSLHARVYDMIIRLPLKSRGDGDGLQPMRDLDQIRSFLSSGGPVAMFDLPWMPLYLGICFAFHFWIGITALVGAIILMIVTIMTEVLTKPHTKAALTAGAQRNTLMEASRRNAEALRAMGMGGRLAAVWGKANAGYIDSQQRINDVSVSLSATAKVLRMVLQSSVLAVGAYLVINQEATAGIIIASSILSARALAPVDMVIANWKNLQGARSGRRRLLELLRRLPEQPERLALPAPRSTLSVEGVSIAPPSDQRLVVTDASFKISAGNALGIIGASASGKTSLARAIVGVWTPVRGSIRLDDAALDQWEPDALGRHIGYLPQAVELFDGTIAENIARFEPDASPDKIVAAAETAGVHQLIVHLPNGYDTRIGEAGTSLSAGQRQRVALARALYGDPFLVVLDEPNSNLDNEGEQALTDAILAVRRRGGAVVVIAHRPSALAGVDLVMMMAAGRIQAFGPKDEVLQKVLRPSALPSKVAIAS